MNYHQILERFILKALKTQPYASKDQIVVVAEEMLEIIKNNKDKTPEELVEMALCDVIEEVERVRKNYAVPGYTIGMKVGRVNVKLIGGFMDSSKRPMMSDALFDIASMHKFNTELIAYNLIKEKVFSFSDLVKELDPRFENVGNLTVGDVLSFTTKFMTNERIAKKKTIDEALECLYTMNVVSIGQYNYNDMGMMLMKELMENVTGKTYIQLFHQYIGNKLNLKDSHLIVPKEKICRLTGSANASLGMPNDPSALAVGGYSGHAGMFASCDDLITLGKGVMDGKILSLDLLKDAYTPGVNGIRGLMGTTYTSHANGVIASYVDCLEPKNNFAIQGSTRVQMNMGNNSISTILLNPASMSLEQAKQEELKVNDNRRSKGLEPLDLVRHYIYNHQNKIQNYHLIDARLMVPSGKTVEPLTTANAKLALKLGLLNEVMHEYDSTYEKEIIVEKSLCKQKK